MAQLLKLDDLPEVLTIIDISAIMRMDIEQARGFARKHRQDLRPFKVGRENRYMSTNFTQLLNSLQKASNQ